MPTHHYRVVPLATPADMGGPIAEIPPLPFVGADVPACMGEADTFEIAGTEGRPAQPSERAAIVAADREAHTVCRRCPLLDGCRAYALTTRQRWGVWGATNLPERLAWLAEHGHDIDRLRSLPVNDDERRRKFEDVETIELFSADAVAVQRGTVERPIRRAVATAGHGNCGNCSTTGVRLFRLGEHYTWAEHYYRTWSGDTRVCRSSGAALCVAPEDENACHGPTPITCPHGPDPLPGPKDITGGCA